MWLRQSPASTSWFPMRGIRTSTCCRQICGCTSSCCQVLKRKDCGGRWRWGCTPISPVGRTCTGPWWKNVWSWNAVAGTPSPCPRQCGKCLQKGVADKTSTFTARAARPLMFCPSWWTQASPHTVHSWWSAPSKQTASTASESEAWSATAPMTVCAADSSFTLTSGSLAGTTGSLRQQGTTGTTVKAAAQLTWQVFRALPHHFTRQ